MHSIWQFTSALEPGTQRWGRHIFLLAVTLALGIFARTWEYGRLPPGLNADEASIGVEAYDLAHYGMDRNGIPYPVHFISWGSGQNALYAYVLIPFVTILGLSPLAVRLPMLLAGWLSLVLVYFVGTQTFDRQTGLLATFFLAISPWHILVSRWALESNILPFVFLAGYACLLLGLQHRGWFLAACTLFGLSLYAYGTAYAVVPAFMLCLILILLRWRSLGRRDIVLGALLFVVVAAPIGLFLIVNTLGLPPVNLGPLTIPRLPVPARYETTTLIGQGNLIGSAAANLWTGVRLMATESDGLIYNVVDPYGVFYHIALLGGLGGVVAVVYQMRRKPGVQYLLLLSWMGACLLLVVFQAVNINRFNLAFMPLLLLAAAAITSLGRRFPRILPASVVILAGAFIAFTVTFHGAGYRQQISYKFHEGLLAALQFAQTEPQTAICVSDEMNMPYVFALFSERTSPAAFLETVKYVDPQAPLRQVQSYGRYTFGSENCAGQTAPTYVLTTEEIPPRLGNRYSYEFFDNYVVYYPGR